MARKVLKEGGVWLAVGLLCSSLNSLLDRFAGTAPAADWARGFLDGLSVVAFGAAIALLVCGARVAGSTSRDQDGR